MNALIDRESAVGASAIEGAEAGGPGGAGRATVAHPEESGISV
jgi:hypothetical protein